jgi:hypothetical protein
MHKVCQHWGTLVCPVAPGFQTFPRYALPVAVTAAVARGTLEAPDGERLALTLQGESARTLVHDDVIALDRKPG